MIFDPPLNENSTDDVEKENDLSSYDKKVSRRTFHKFSQSVPQKIPLFLPAAVYCSSESIA
jgi:hypothetical protein